MSKLELLIEKAKLIDDFETSEPATCESIHQLSDALSVKFPVSYITFLERHGALIFGGFRVSVIYRNHPIMTNEGCTYGDTIECRKRFGLPSSYVVIAYDDDGELIYCLDANSIDSSGECSVIFFDKFLKKSLRIHETFESWLIESLEIRLV